ncbi:caspase-7-like [Euwallacea fornicatus]|uniref:caspase-7-like n=1 Tax=Euwallacea fornicatus TaxID=995702 RepID=UPI00338E0E7C
MSLQKTTSDTTPMAPRTDKLSRTVINHASVVPLKEREHLLPLDNFEYNRKGSEPGRVIIFNQEFGDDHVMIREGSRRDVNEIIMCFQRLGFNMSADDVLLDSTAKQITHKLKSVANDQESLEKINCLIIFFLTHGETNNDLLVKQGTISCNDIWAEFLTCPTLMDKPKMFVFQACKGKKFASIGESNFVKREPAQLLDMDNFSFTQLTNDMLVLFSTIEGNQSYRHTVSGTWFIQELCKNFTMYGRRDDVISLVTRTMKCICGNYYHENEISVFEKQMPIFVSTLTKKFYLNRNKDRHLLLEIRDKQDEMLELLKEIWEFVKQQKTSKK